MKTVIIATFIAAGAFTAGKAAQVSATPTDPVLAELRALRVLVEQIAEIQARLAVANLQSTTHVQNSAVQQRLAVISGKREAVAKQVAWLENAVSQPVHVPKDPALQQGLEIGAQMNRDQLVKERAELSRLEQEEQALTAAAADAANGLLQAQAQLQELQRLLSASARK